MKEYFKELAIVTFAMCVFGGTAILSGTITIVVGVYVLGFLFLS